jgi:hypothetical protein
VVYLAIAVLAIGERWTEASCPLNDSRKSAAESGICGLFRCRPLPANARRASAAWPAPLPPTMHRGEVVLWPTNRARSLQDCAVPDLITGVVQVHGVEGVRLGHRRETNKGRACLSR